MIRRRLQHSFRRFLSCSTTTSTTVAAAHSSAAHAHHAGPALPMPAVCMSQQGMRFGSACTCWMRQGTGFLRTSPSCRDKLLGAAMHKPGLVETSSTCFALMGSCIMSIPLHADASLKPRDGYLLRYRQNTSPKPCLFQIVSSCAVSLQLGSAALFTRWYSDCSRCMNAKSPVSPYHSPIKHTVVPLHHNLR